MLREENHSVDVNDVDEMYGLEDQTEVWVKYNHRMNPHLNDIKLLK
jgi:hypothetical protein